MLGLLVIIIILTSKKNIINLILLYQKYAPEKIRMSCLFEPTCSEYMILAIKKYGIIKGIYKGIKRLLRCHSPNGGIDYP
jgi:putative membrane protein insertion efficiency factor